MGAQLSIILVVDDAKKLANAIAERLFTNGDGKNADRLVLELPGKIYGGGWCKHAAADQIMKVLREIQ